MSVSSNPAIVTGHETETLRPHPPRLQHSPSMPNIWFPPHSGPIPHRLIENCGDLLKCPTPLPPSVTNALKATDIRRDAAISQDAQVQADDVAEDGSTEARPLPPLTKSVSRRRLNYDQPNLLITPPSTPSSSIRTAGSIDSNLSYPTSVDSHAGPHQRITNGEDEIGFSDPDMISTHFLLLQNVSRTVNSEKLQFAILRTLAARKHVAHSNGTPSMPPPNKSTNVLELTIDSIKGVLLRYHESHGIAILAFYDVRQAKSAQVLLSTPIDNSALAECIGEDTNGGAGGWLECAFVTAKDLTDMVGQSSFLAEIQGSFLLTVDVVPKPPASTGTEARREIGIATVTSLLKAYGGLRSFGLASDTEQTSSHKVFCVEYYDVREARVAHTGLNGKVLFGMRLFTSDLDSEPSETGGSLTTGDAQSCIPFPSSGPAHEKSLLQFQPAGKTAQIRERYLFIDTTGKARPRSISDSHESLEGSHPSVPTGSSDSPPYFYKSPTSGVHSPRTPESHSRRASNHLFFDATSCNTPSDQQTPKRPRSVSFGSVAGTGRDERHDMAVASRAVRPQDPRPQADYCYPMDRFPHPYYNAAAVSHLPSAYPYDYSPHASQLASPVHGYSGPPSPYPYTYDYDMQAHIPAAINMNMGNWTFEQAMMVPGMYGFPYTPTNASPVSEYWQGSPAPSPQHTAFFQYPPPPLSPDSPLFKPPQHPPLIHSVHFPGAPSSSSVASSRAVVPSSVQPVNNSAERNQLNLARIEDGQDTRTTVMIKNIPNKMSDKDLMAYIGNACNVGYAFVNFISVQDLLHFAKAKLGEKWNMFSSEKVLQMSYANYQFALVEKFKNSCIMDERLAWQPKIFYSDGPEQGLPEPFPAPTHLRRKERSSYNRGPLYVPGMMSGLQPSLHRRQPQGR
ncbi:meiosis protein mei2 [Favolaschia claudopus]|uniref:Meiosis protein mei2 n=1 Tax=Favolaschia claudopus TaxID=2862362 RepID=A0AAW0A8W5_9AGAR